MKKSHFTDQQIAFAVQQAEAGVGDTPLHDQRGAPYTRVFAGRIDTGSFEAQTLPAFFGDYIEKASWTPPTIPRGEMR